MLEQADNEITILIAACDKFADRQVIHFQTPNRWHALQCFRFVSRIEADLPNLLAKRPFRR